MQTALEVSGDIDEDEWLGDDDYGFGPDDELTVGPGPARPGPFQV